MIDYLLNHGQYFYKLNFLSERGTDGLTPTEVRIEELRHRLKIEKAVQDGAKNVIRSLQSTKGVDKKALQEVWRHTAFKFIVFLLAYFMFRKSSVSK